MQQIKKWRKTVSEATPGHNDQGQWPWLAISAVVIGVALRIWQYAANPSLWVDEAAIARNVLDRHPSALFGSLDYGQIAPPGFLLMVKLSVTLLGSSEYALRLVPFVAGIASPALFYIVARSVLRPAGTIVATLMFSMAIPLLYFSSNLKQYSSDIAITLLVIGIAFRFYRSALTLRSAYGFAFLSVPVLICSHAAVFPLTVASAVVFTDAFVARRSDRRYRIIAAALWAAAVIAAVSYSLSVMTAADNVYMHRFWEQAFMPREGAIQWLWTTAKYIFAGPLRPDAFDGSLHYAFPGLFAALVVVGGIALCVRAPVIGALVSGPIVLTLIASMARAYPFGTRATLFLLPLLVMVVVAGAEYMTQKFVEPRVGDYALALLLLFAIAALVQQLPPRRPEHLRPVMQYVSDHGRPDDALWVYYGAGQAFEYYAKLIPFHGDVRVGDCNRSDPREYLRQVDAERGRERVWILMSHGSAAFRLDERTMLFEYLETIGHQVDEFHAPPDDSSPNGAAVFLFDLSDPKKLSRTSAELFVVPKSYLPMTWTCYGTMSPHGASSKIVEALMGEKAP